MKRLKTLIRIELPPVVAIFLYFLVINFIDLIGIRNGMKGIEEKIIRLGIQNPNNEFWYLRVMDEFKQVILFTMFMYGIGIIILVFNSFSKDKGNETGRFLMTLPYTLEERMKVKVSLGLGSYVVGILTLGNGLIIQRSRAIAFFNRLIDEEMILSQYLTIGYVMKIILIMLFSGMGFYLFMVMMQYILNHNIGCIINSIFIFYSPLFILINSKHFGNLEHSRGIDKGIDFLCALLLGPWEELSYDAEHITYAAETFFNMKDIGSYMIVWSLIIVGILIGIFKLSKTFSIDRSDVFIPNKVFRWIYIVGTTVCGTLLVGDIYLLFSFKQDKAMFYFFTFVGVIISGMAAFKIGHIGLNAHLLKYVRQEIKE